jgi:hypothetical protein
LQEFETLLFIMNAVENQPAKVGDDPVRRAKAILAEERAILNRGLRHKCAPVPNTPDFPGWRHLSRRMFTLVGEVDKALKK